MGEKLSGNVAVVVFPGSNCDRDMYEVLKKVYRVNARLIWHEDPLPKNLDAVVIPGGFTYGDRLRAGIIAAHSPVMKEIKSLSEKGTPILGVCNGFQILVESGLLPGALLRNTGMTFMCQRVEIEVRNNKTPFTSKLSVGESIPISIANGEGRYYADKALLEVLKKNDQIVFTYKNVQNGSIEEIAGICNKEGNVVGMMPHPERSSEEILNQGKSDPAKKIFKSFMDAIR